MPLAPNCPSTAAFRPSEIAPDRGNAHRSNGGLAREGRHAAERTIGVIEDRAIHIETDRRITMSYAIIGFGEIGHVALAVCGDRFGVDGG